MADHAKAQVTIRADERERVGLAAAAMKMAAALIANQVIPPPSVPHADSAGSQPSLIPPSRNKGPWSGRSVKCTAII